MLAVQVNEFLQDQYFKLKKMFLNNKTGPVFFSPDFGRFSKSDSI